MIAIVASSLMDKGGKQATSLFDMLNNFIIAKSWGATEQNILNKLL